MVRNRRVFLLLSHFTHLFHQIADFGENTWFVVAMATVAETTAAAVVRQQQLQQLLLWQLRQQQLRLWQLQQCGCSKCGMAGVEKQQSTKWLDSIEIYFSGRVFNCWCWLKNKQIIQNNKTIFRSSLFIWFQVWFEWPGWLLCFKVVAMAAAATAAVATVAATTAAAAVRQQQLQQLLLSQLRQQQLWQLWLQ